MTTAGFPKYESYKESGVKWIGKFPQHWKELPLKHLSKIHAGNGFPIELQGDYLGTIPFLKVSDFQKGMTFISKAKNLVSKRTVNSRNWNIVPSGSLVTAKIGEALRQNHRNIVEVDCVIDNNCIAFEPQSVEPIFFFYLHKLIDFDWFVNPGAVPSISVQKYRSQSVVLPPLPEQRAIAAFLDNKCAAIDEAVRIQQAQIALLQERRQILIQQAVTRGLNPNVPLKDSGIDWIGQIPAHWEVKRSKHLFREVNERSEEGVEELLSVSHTTGVTARSEKNVNMFLAEDYSGSKLCRPDDIVINTMWAWMGALGVSDMTGIVSPSYGVYRSIQKNTFNRHFLEWLLRTVSFIEQYNKISTGLHSSRLRLYPHMFLGLYIAHPNREEQDVIVDYVLNESEKITTAITLKNSQITALKEYKTVLINAAVTGKIKVI